MKFHLHVLLFSFFLVTASVFSIGMRHDVEELEYLKLAANGEGYEAGPFPNFSAVAAVGVSDRRRGFEVIGSGTLISPNFILTASHVILSERKREDFEPNLRVRVGKSTAEGFEEYRVIAIHTPLPAAELRALQGSIRYTEKQVVKAEFHDVALLQLDRVVENVHPMAWDESGDDLLGKLVYISGYGDSATGNNPKERSWTTAELRRAAENVIDRDIRLDPFTKKPQGGLIIFDFDNGQENRNSLNAKSRVWERIFGRGRSSATPTKLEGASYPGDSGGPAFARVGDQWRIVGVSGYGTGYPPDKRRTTIQYGDILVYTRIQSHANWIRSIVGPPPSNPVPGVELLPAIPPEEIEGELGTEGEGEMPPQLPEGETPPSPPIPTDNPQEAPKPEEPAERRLITAEVEPVKAEAERTRVSRTD